MVEVDCEELKNCIIQLSKQVNRYSANRRDILLEYENIRNHWSGGHLVRDTFLKIDSNVKDSMKVLSELEEEVSILSKAIAHYEEFGPKVMCNTNHKEIMIDSCTQVISHINELIQEYGGVTYVNSSSIRNRISGQKQELRNQRDKMIMYRDSIREQISKILVIENDIRKGIQNIPLLHSTEPDVIFWSDDESVEQEYLKFEEDEIGHSMEKLNIFLEEEESARTRIVYYLEEIPNYYKTRNVDDIDELNHAIIRLLKNIHESYLESNQEMNQILQNMKQAFAGSKRALKEADLWMKNA